MFKRLVGHGVLSVSGQLEMGREVRVYAFCTKNGDWLVKRCPVPSGAKAL